MTEISNVDGIITLKLTGRLDLQGVGEIENSVKEATALASKGLLLDMSEVAFLASLGMRMLMVAAKTMQGKNGKIVVISPVEDVENALRMSGLDQVIPIVDNHETAINEL